MISNILFKKPVPVGALFLSDDHLESVHRILADLVYVENETKTEGSNIMQEITKDIPMQEAYSGKPSLIKGSQTANRQPRNAEIEDSLHRLSTKCLLLNKKLFELIDDLEGNEHPKEQDKPQGQQIRPMAVILDTLASQLDAYSNQISDGYEKIEKIRSLIL